MPDDVYSNAQTLADLEDQTATEMISGDERETASQPSERAESALQQQSAPAERASGKSATQISLPTFPARSPEKWNDTVVTPLPS